MWLSAWAHAPALKWIVFALKVMISRLSQITKWWQPQKMQQSSRCRRKSQQPVLAELFYTPDPEMFEVMDKYGIVGVEMEAAGIYGVCTEYGAKALTICTGTWSYQKPVSKPHQMNVKRPSMTWWLLLSTQCCLATKLLFCYRKTW